MMSKIETVVFKVAVAFAAFGALTSPAYAQAPATPAALALGNARETDCDGETASKLSTTEALKHATDSNRTALKKSYDQAYNNWVKCRRDMKGGGTASGETCRDAKGEFTKAKGKFGGACSNAGLDSDNPTDSGKEGSIACSWSKNRCQCLNKGVSEDASAKYRCSEGGRSDRLSATTQSAGMIDIGQAKKRLELCPHEDPDDTERYEKQLEKAQERVKDAKKKMPELMNKGTEAQDKAAEKQNEAQRKSAELQKEFAKEVLEIKKKKSGEEQQAVAKMAQARGEMDKVDAQIRQYELNKVDAEVKLSEAKTGIELNCHASASQQVAARQTAKMASIAKGKPSGDFNKMMNSVGVSSRAAWEKVADVYYTRCLKSRPTREAKTNARNIYESTVRGIDSAIQVARQDRRRLEDSINQVMSKSGCAAPATQAGVPSGETEMCRSAREANEEMIQAQQNAATQHQQLQAEVATAQKQLATKNQALATEYADSQQELNDEQKRIENLRAYLNLKREKSNGVGGKEAAKTLGETYGGLVTAAENIVQCYESQGGSNDPINPELNKTAVEFLHSIGQLTESDREKFLADPIAPETRALANPVPGGTTTNGGEGVRETTTPR